MAVLRRRSLKVCGDTSGRQLEPREPGRQLEQQLQELHGGQSNNNPDNRNNNLGFRLAASQDVNR